MRPAISLEFSASCKSSAAIRRRSTGRRRSSRRRRTCPRSSPRSSPGSTKVTIFTRRVVDVDVNVDVDVDQVSKQTDPDVVTGRAVDIDFPLGKSNKSTLDK